MNTLFTTIRRIVYNSIGNIDVMIGNRNNLFILCYHSVANDGWRFSIPASTIQKQTEYLMRTHVPISLDDLWGHINGQNEINRPSFIVTFDDGYENLMGMKDFFMKKKIQPALFVMADPKQADRKELGTNNTLLSEKQIKELKNAGWTIGCHSSTHADFRTLTPKQIVQEIDTSKSTLEKKLEMNIEYFSYPKGVYSDAIIEQVKKSGYKMAVSMDDGFITKHTTPLVIPRIGVDGTHTFDEFTVLFMPSVVQTRNAIKNLNTLLAQ